MKKRFSTKDVVIMLATVMVGGAVIAYANVTVPNTFTTGATAKSADVNANFSYLAERSWDKSGNNLLYNSGNVGIGTDTPQAALHVKYPGVAGDQAAISIQGGHTSTSNMAYIEFRDGAFNSLGYVGDGASGSNRIELKSHTDTIMMSNNSNAIYMYNENVGIGGNTTPSYPLQMASGAYVTTGGVWTNASSRAYKDNIADLSSEKALSAFKDLKPVTYTYKTDKTERHVGFIAEDVPAIVATKDRKGVSSMDVTALLTKVVQEQQVTIALLSNKVSALEAKAL